MEYHLVQFTKDQTLAIVKDEDLSTSSDGQLLAYYKQSKGAKTENFLAVRQASSSKFKNVIVLKW